MQNAVTTDRLLHSSRFGSKLINLHLDIVGRHSLFLLKSWAQSRMLMTLKVASAMSLLSSILGTIIVGIRHLKCTALDQ